MAKINPKFYIFEPFQHCLLMLTVITHNPQSEKPCHFEKEFFYIK